MKPALFAMALYQPIIDAALRDYDSSKARCGGDWLGCEPQRPYVAKVGRRCPDCPRYMEIVDAVEAAGLRPKYEGPEA